MGALAEFVRKKFGVATRLIQNPVTDTCGTSVTTLLLNNPDRLMWMIVNLGTKALYVAWDKGVASDHGVYVSPNGGTVSAIADEDGEMVGYPVYGVAPAGAVDIFVIEVEAE